MPVNKITSNSVIDSEFFNFLRQFQIVKKEDGNSGLLTFSNEAGESIDLNIWKVFTSNTLMINHHNSETGDSERISYETVTPIQLHSLVIYLSSNYPQLVFTNTRGMCAALISFSDNLQRRRKEDVRGKKSHYFTVEECASRSYVNIICDSDAYLKIDLIDNRFFIFYKGKIGVASLYYLQPTELVVDKLHELFDALGIDITLITRELIYR